MPINHAIQIYKTGGPEVIELNKISFPSPKPDEILISLTYNIYGTSVDTYFRRGIYPVTQFPYTLGAELAGKVLALPTSEEVLNDKEYKSHNLKVGDNVVARHTSGFSRYRAVPWTQVAPLPEGVSTRLAAAACISGLTALTFLKEAYTVKPNDWILIHAAAGGFGIQATQLAKKFGARVIGTVSTPEKASLAKQHGADYVINHTRENVVEKVLEFTGGAGVQAVYDGVGKDTQVPWDDNFSLIARKGTIVSLGNASGVVPPFSPLKLVTKNLKLCRPTVNTYLVTPEERLSHIPEYFNYLAEGSVKVVIHKEYPFSAEGVRQAQEDLMSRGTVGKLLIKIRND
ncbi:NAD-binding protein [Cantharellus anzutake]|uniref:NAD-binding protein n=1 Tax=Cantharellus anzutake TaxID=1750568 RepID=UPI0019087022|nr:NAD-binding protein [Cantharellus anzutake]KAF8342217.1 NAD-binding protein [Cantharellus anzutake]